MILENKKVVIMGVRNKWSIAFGAVKSASEQGAKVKMYNIQKQTLEKVKQLLEEIPDSKYIYVMMLGKDRRYRKMFRTNKKRKWKNRWNFTCNCTCKYR